MTEKRCVICARLIDPKRRAGWPHAATCGKPACAKENRRRVHNDLALRLKRQRAAKKELAQRAPQTGDRGAFDAFLASARKNVTGGLRRAAGWLGLSVGKRKGAAPQ